MIYSSGSKKDYHRGLGHVGERLEQKSGNESVLEVTEKWTLNIIDCKKVDLLFICIAVELF